MLQRLLCCSAPPAPPVSNRGMHRLLISSSSHNVLQVTAARAYSYEPESAYHLSDSRNLYKPTALSHQSSRQESPQFFCLGAVGATPYPKALCRSYCLPSRGRPERTGMITWREGIDRVSPRSGLPTPMLSTPNWHCANSLG